MASMEVDQIPGSRAAEEPTVQAPSQQGPKPFFFSSFQIFLLCLYNFALAVTYASIYPVIGFAYVLKGKISAETLAIVQAALGVVSLYLNIGISNYGDRLVSLYGRRKPLIAIGTLLIFLGGTIISFPDEASVNLIGQVTVALTFVTFGGAFQSTSYNSWIYEVCTTQREYVTVNAYTTLAFVLGVIPTSGVVFFAGDNLHAIQLGLFFTFFIFLGISLPLLMWSVPSPTVEKSPEQFGIVPSIRQCWRLKEFRVILSNNILIYTAQSMANCAPGFTTLAIGYGFTYLSDVKAYLVYIGPSAFGGAILGYLVALRALAQNWMDKLAMYQRTTILSALLVVAIHLTLIPSVVSYDYPVSQGEFHSALIGFIILGFLGGFFGIINSFTSGLLFRDLLKFDAFLFDLDRENMFQVAFNTPVNIISNLVGSFFGAILLATGLNIGSSNAENAKIADVYHWNQGTNVQIVLYGSAVAGILFYMGWRLLEVPPYPLTTRLAEQMSKCVEKRNDIKVAKDGAASQVEEAHTKNPVNAGGEGDDKITEGKNADEIIARRAKILKLEDFNYFSDAEILHIAAKAGSGSSGDAKDGLLHVGRMPKMGAYFGGPLTLVVLVIAIAGMYSTSERPPFALMVVTLFQAVSLYEYYELGRLWACERLLSMPVDEFVSAAKDAKESIEKYSLALQELLDEHRIDATLEESSPDLMRFSTLPTATRSSDPTRGRRSTIITAPEVDTTDNLHGYKRIFASLAVIILFSLIVVVINV